MGNNYFKFKQFTVYQDRTAMKVGVDAVLLGAWITISSEKHILDIGTGTGLLSLMMAQRSEAQIDAVEIEKEAFEQAIHNIKVSKWPDKVKVIHLPIQEYLSIQKYDLIICNPPYFSNSLNAQNEDRNLARHDDSLSLEELFDAVLTYLTDNGRFCLIYPYVKSKTLIDIGEERGLFPVRICEVQGHIKKQPNRIMVEFSKNKAGCIHESIIIRDNLTNNYTDEYKQLTKDFYLAF